MKKLWQTPPVRLVQEMATLYFSTHVSRSAAELAYFLILSFFPVLICVHTFVAALHLDADMVVKAAEAFIPHPSFVILGDYIEYITSSQSRAMVFTGVSATLFSASAALRSLFNIFHDLYGEKERAGVREVVFSVLLALLFLFVTYFSLVVLVTGEWFLHFLETSFGLKNPIGAWWWMRFLILFLFLLLLILLLYRASVPRRNPRPPIFTGAFFAATVLVAASVLFSWFVGMSTRYPLIYGSLSSVIVLLVWLYLCGNILILGVVFNVIAYRRQRAKLP